MIGQISSRDLTLQPGKPGRPVSDGGRGGHDLSARHHSAVPFLVRALAGHGEIGVSCLQRAHQSVDVASDGTAVRRHSGRVN